MLIEDVLGSGSEWMGRSKPWHYIGFIRRKYQRQQVKGRHLPFNYWKWVRRALNEGGCGNNHSIKNGNALCQYAYCCICHWDEERVVWSFPSELGRRWAWRCPRAKSLSNAIGFEAISCPIGEGCRTSALTAQCWWRNTSSRAQWGEQLQSSSSRENEVRRAGWRVTKSSWTWGGLLRPDSMAGLVLSLRAGTHWGHRDWPGCSPGSANPKHSLKLWHKCLVSNLSKDVSIFTNNISIFHASIYPPWLQNIFSLFQGNYVSHRLVVATSYSKKYLFKVRDAGRGRDQCFPSLQAVPHWKSALTPVFSLSMRLLFRDIGSQGCDLTFPFSVSSPALCRSAIGKTPQDPSQTV